MYHHMNTHMGATRSGFYFTGGEIPQHTCDSQGISARMTLACVLYNGLMAVGSMITHVSVMTSHLERERIYCMNIYIYIYM